jgi:hypothetical protein
MKREEQDKLQEMTLRQLADGQLDILQELLESRQSLTLREVRHQLQDLVTYNNQMHRLIRRF